VKSAPMSGFIGDLDSGTYGKGGVLTDVSQGLCHAQDIYGASAVPVEKPILGR
jgi:hypothetical protein